MVQFVMVVLAAIRLTVIEWLRVRFGVNHTCTTVGDLLSKEASLV